MKPLDRRVMDLLGTDWCGHSAPPLANRRIYIRDDDVTRVFATWDDGGFVGIGYPNEWQTHMRTKAARMFAWWMLRCWLADWCGLRSHLYYRALSHSVKGTWNPHYPRSSPLTRRSSFDEWEQDA